ncbi:MAG: class C sortase [Peptococcaceae bacterium]|nr:class C sortase [Peptococcaceae bacterium]
MKIKIIRITAILLLIAGVVVLLYPRVTNFYYNKNVTQTLRSFETDIDIDNAELESLYQWMVAENEKLFTSGQKDLFDPFSYEQPGFDLTKYGLTDNIVGYITIPRMDLILPIYLGASHENMFLGAVHLTQTSYPVGGSNTNCVIAAHRGYSKALMFRRIELLEIGDPVEIRNFRETLTYKVVKTDIIDPSDIPAILIQPQKELITLITCHPLGGNKQRYLVFCERVQ